MELKKSKTYQNLANAYAGECQAYVRYRFIEYGARYNGFACLAEMIDTKQRISSCSNVLHLYSKG